MEAGVGGSWTIVSRISTCLGGERSYARPPHVVNCGCSPHTIHTSPAPHRYHHLRRVRTARGYPRLSRASSRHPRRSIIPSPARTSTGSTSPTHTRIVATTTAASQCRLTGAASPVTTSRIPSRISRAQYHSSSNNRCTSNTSSRTCNMEASAAATRHTI